MDITIVTLALGLVTFLVTMHMFNLHKKLLQAKEISEKSAIKFSYYADFLEQMLHWHCIEYDKPPQYKEIHDLVDSIVEETNWGSMVEANSWFDDYYHASKYKGGEIEQVPSF
tara:strand:+ start:712 stop:1050 length:339 start_codon:yes stop_codon:yes gene_type:complete